MCGAPNFSMTDFASALTASVEHASSAKVLSVFSAFNFAASRSVATTSAPSAMKVAAIAAPMPCPAAVMKARLPLRRPVTFEFSLARLLVIIPRHELFRDALVFDRRLEHHAVGELIDHAALDLLPRRLMRRIREAARLLQRRAPLREFGVADEHIGPALVQIDAHAVSGLQ